MTASTSPVLLKLLPMFPRPLDHEPQGSWRHLAREHAESLDLDRCLVVPVARVEVRPTEVVYFVVVHPDDDPVEGADPRHQAILAVVPVKRRARAGILHLRAP